MSDPVALTLSRNFAAGSSDEGAWTRISIDIVETPTGCMLTPTHEMDAGWSEHEPQARRGWTTTLDSLARIMEKP